MIFIGGLQPRTIRTRKLPNGCLNCGHFEVYEQRVDHYLTLFFVPLFPIKKGKPVIACDHCGAAHGSFSTRPQHCASCGRETDPGFQYCPHCGKRL